MKNLIQRSLDKELNTKGILVHSQRKSGREADEYIVYTTNGDSEEQAADNESLTKTSKATIKYYYRNDLASTYEGKQKTTEVEEAIKKALKTVQITVPNGAVDVGDIEDIGYYCTVFEAEYWRVI